MKRLTPIPQLVSLTFIMLIAVNQVYAQMPGRNYNTVYIVGWTDDSHYIIRNYDENKTLVNQSVDIKTGKSVIVPRSKSDRELLSESLPAGESLKMNDVFSSDMSAVISVRDNDIYYFVKGDKDGV